MRQVWKRQQQRVSLLVNRRQFSFQTLDPPTARFVLGENTARVLARFLGARHGLACCVLVALEAFHLREETSTGGFETGKGR